MEVLEQPPMNIERLQSEAARLSAPSGRFVRVRILSHPRVVAKSDLRAIPAAEVLLPGDGTCELQPGCVAEIRAEIAEDWLRWTRQNRHLPPICELA